MFVPGITKRSSRLERRKGGGGGGRGGGGGGGIKGGSGGAKPAPGPPVSGANGRTGSPNSFGGGKASTIPAGQPFAGRSQGGGTRDSIYGTPYYGSGYVGQPGAVYGARGAGFPFFFWPLAWGGVAGAGGYAYLHNDEYGRPDNSSRPGGAMQIATYPSKATNATYRVVADKQTVDEIIKAISSNCSSVIASNSSTTSSPYNPNDPAPQPEQAVQYYRASSLAVTLDGYNNTGLLEGSNQPPSPLPPWNDQPLLDCLNYTVGNNAVLIDGALTMAVPSMGALGLLWMAFFAMSQF